MLVTVDIVANFQVFFLSHTQTSASNCIRSRAELAIYDKNFLLFHFM